MSRSVYLASSEGETGKSTVALGLADLLTRTMGRVGVFRPITKLDGHHDRVVQTLLAHPGIDQEYDEAIGVTYNDMHTDPEAALATIVDRFHSLEATKDSIIVLGSDYTDLSTPNELHINARIAANLGVPVILVVHGRDRSPQDIRTVVDLAKAELAHGLAHPIAVFANRVEPDDLDEVVALLSAHEPGPAFAIPEIPSLVAPTVHALMEACEGTLVRGNPEWLWRESMGFVVAAMSLPNVLTRLQDACTVIAPGDRSDLLPALLMAHSSGTFPRLASIVLTGGYRLPDPVARLIDGIQHDLPILVTQDDTFETAATLAAVKGRMNPFSEFKMDTARRIFAERVDGEELLRALDLAEAHVVTPLMFQHTVMDRARRGHKRIVLPEAGDARILEAAAIILRLGVADIILLGDENTVRAKASGLGLDITEAQIISPHDPDLVTRFAEEYARLRRHKGMTVETAYQVVQDISYFGTMMVHFGLADGMVSGAANTTAHTIRPSFEIIKTVPGTNVVSSVFFMCLADRVLVYGDCAVNPDPTAEQLADIAISSADTARSFGIEPRVALLSYSTGSSGHGADVEKVRAAAEIVHATRPDLMVEGPIQYDAAVDPDVAASKLPDSEVAGKATVLIFPDLNTGNNTYKAVQRSAGAIAVGPVLQGLNKPVNDLSRGALVADIVNTVAMTAIQAAEQVPVAEQVLP